MFKPPKGLLAYSSLLPPAFYLSTPLSFFTPPLFLSYFLSPLFPIFLPLSTSPSPSPAEPENDDSKGCIWHRLLPTTFWVHPLPEPPEMCVCEGMGNVASTSLTCNCKKGAWEQSYLLICSCVKFTSSANSEGKVNDFGTSFDYHTISGLKFNILASQTSMKLW